jgi:hypothetical protein
MSGALKTEELEFLKNFFQSLTLSPIAPDDPRYAPLYELEAFRDQDPVSFLTRGVQFFEGHQSVQLFSGYRGSGKSTELRRLRRDLDGLGHVVLLIDIEEYLDSSSPVDISSFLVALCGAFSDALEGKLEKDFSRETYWGRFVHFLQRTQVEVPEVSAGLTLGAGDPKVASASAGAQFKVSLRTDPSFRQSLEGKMHGRLGALVEDAHQFLQGCVEQTRQHIKQQTLMTPEVVLLVDSIEHFRGTTTNDAAVQESLVSLFSVHASKLKLPGLHVVYTVPPYLKLRVPGIEASYEPGGLYTVHSLKVCDQQRKREQSSYDALADVVQRRGEWGKLLGDRRVLDELIELSGGHLRDLFRLLQEILRRTRELPAPEGTVDAAIRHVCSNLLPIADEDALALAQIAETHQANISAHTPAELARFARYLETHLALCYLNGEEWYEVHPLIREHVIRQARTLREAATLPG